MFGDTYQLVFVTRDSIQAISPNRATYDTFAQTQAMLNPDLNGIVFHAIVATLSNPNMQSNTNVVAPVYLLSGTLVDTGSAGFWDGNHNAPIDVTQFGDSKFSDVWAGCSSASGEGCLSMNTLGNLSAAVAGNSVRTDTGWAVDSTDTMNFNFMPIFAISQELTVTPLPAALPLFATGLGVIGLLARRRKRKAAALAAA